MNRKLWVVAIALWFLLWGLFRVSNIQFEMQHFLMEVLAITIAVLLIIDR